LSNNFYKKIVFVSKKQYGVYLMTMISTHFFKKSLGQNFIFDEGFLGSVVKELNLSKSDVIVEVGTGAGSLTRVLARHAARVITYEIDTRLTPELPDNVEMHYADIMKVNFEAKNSPFYKGGDASASGVFKLVANIPYYITTPLLLKFMSIPECTELCVLVQDDVALRIVAVPGTKEYGALSVTLQSQGDCRIIRHVSRKQFKPVPNVDSAFVHIKKRHCERSEATPSHINNNLIKAMFAARRKTVLNALKQALCIDTDSARKILDKCGIDETIRPENISVDKYIELSRTISR